MLPLVGIFGKAGSGKSTVARILQEEFGVASISLADPLKLLAKKAFPEISERQLFGPSSAREELVEGLYRRFRYGTAEANAAIGLLTHFAETRFGVEHNSAMTTSQMLLSTLQKKLNEGAVPSARLVCQYLGTEWGRVLAPNGWRDEMLRTADRLLGGGLDVDPDTRLLVPQATPRACTGVSVPDTRFLNEGLGIRRAGGFCLHVSRPGAATTSSVHTSETQMDLIGDWMYAAKIINNGTEDDLRTVVRLMWRRVCESHLLSPSYSASSYQKACHV